MSAVINVEGLSKRFIIGHEEKERYVSLRDVIAKKARQLVSVGKKRQSSFTREEFWALRDVDFAIHPGERVGIIGRNGAGKSTLLKVLSRITEPTSGRITIRGRVASLLEVGTGFHPELSGRENIFLNGAILGMSRVEIRKKFDEIVAFAEVARFLDTPVKRYSSGMYVRLAFAVAAHLEPEILIVDEVLAVGDAEFQKKCLGKMDNLSKEQGRTVLFVSHNMGVINQLCSKTIVLNGGKVLYSGQTANAIDLYMNSSKSQETQKMEKAGGGGNQFLSVYNCDLHGSHKMEYKFDEGIFLDVELQVPDWRPTLELAISLYDRHKRRVFTIHEPLQPFYEGKAHMRFRVEIPGSFLTPGMYSWLMCINYPGNELYDVQDDICNFSILETGSSFSQYENADYGCVFVSHKIKPIN